MNLYFIFYFFIFGLSMAHRSSHVFRDSVMEILFEQDNEEKSVASLMLDALVKVGRSNFEVLLFVWQL